MLTPFELFAILAILAGTAETINTRFLKWPSAIGLVSISLAIGIIVIFLDMLGVPAADTAKKVLPQNEQYKTYFTDSGLALLLYSAAISSDIRALKKTVLPIILFATIGVIVSTILVAIGVVYAGRFLGIGFSWQEALLFGAIISPTDAMAVFPLIAVIQGRRAWKSILSGESLLNDAMALLLFTLILSWNPEDAGAPISSYLLEFARDAGFAIAIGVGLALLLGSITFLGPSSKTGRILLSLGLATGSYALALNLGVSGPIAVVSAGLMKIYFVTNTSLHNPLSEALTFWKIVGTTLSAMFFFMIGLEIITIYWSWFLILLAVIGWVLVLIARGLTVSLGYATSTLFFHVGRPWDFILPMSLAGVRGAVSIALVLSLYGGMMTTHYQELVIMTFGTVFIGLIAQGACLHALSEKLKNQPIDTFKLRGPLRATFVTTRRKLRRGRH